MDELKNQPVTEKKVLNADTVSDEKVVQENLEKYDSESRYRRPEGFWKMAIKVICIAFSLFQFYTAGFGVLPAHIQRPLHVFFAFVLVFLLYPSCKSFSRKSMHWFDVILAVVSGATMISSQAAWITLRTTEDPPGSATWMSVTTNVQASAGSAP